MQSHRGSKKVNHTYNNHQMLVSSPRCSLNCQGLSIHLPPLGQQRDISGYNYISPPMSASFSPHDFDRPSPKVQSSYPIPPTSPLSHPLFAGDRQSHVTSKTTYPIKGGTEDMRGNVSTQSTTSGSRQTTRPSSEISKFVGDSNDELSSNTQDSPETQQLLPGPPGIARRAKAHVPSACVNCKKKHLACETKRPCSRCVSTGKEVSESPNP